jgi:hypothetical protein
MRVEIDHENKTVTVWHPETARPNLHACICGFGGLIILVMAPIIDWIAKCRSLEV